MLDISFGYIFEGEEAAAIPSEVNVNMLCWEFGNSSVFIYFLCIIKTHNLKK